MWFSIKKNAAPLYNDEMNRRMFATASGRPKGAKKLKKLKTAGEKEEEKGKRKLLWGRENSPRSTELEQ